MIFHMAFSVKAVGGGLCGTIVASMMSAMRFGVARGVFSNEAGMGSAAITAAAATTDHPVRQGYINTDRNILGYNRCLHDHRSCDCKLRYAWSGQSVTPANCIKERI